MMQHSESSQNGAGIPENKDKNKPVVIDLISKIKSEVNKIQSKTFDHGIFILKSGSQWLKEASEKPIPQSLFMKLWHEGEVCVLFSDTNLGKSILAVQIAEEISQKCPVIYLDFELSDKQFEARYSNEFKNHYPFSDNFLRAEINPEEADYIGAGFKTLEEYINQSLENMIVSTGAKIVIIDNITYLRNETDKSKEALPLMKDLKSLKKKYNLSILVLAHTPKRNLSLPINQNDLSGSKMLMNFCDSAFAIGESAKDKSLRYIKQIKERYTEKIYGADNVAIYEITKPDNFLTFRFVHTSCEHEHLREYTKEVKEDLVQRAKELDNKGKSQRQIALELGISLGSVNKYLKSI